LEERERVGEGKKKVKIDRGHDYATGRKGKCDVPFAMVEFLE
jgi:hypothetical protein